ncbi:MAG: hypothetical protein HYZ53_08865 [Planctomycetes bacterium]|nr:hypothetical protein [Planctomycetota bacterium]
MRDFFHTLVALSAVGFGCWFLVDSVLAVRRGAIVPPIGIVAKAYVNPGTFGKIERARDPIAFWIATTLSALLGCLGLFAACLAFSAK